MLHAVFYELVFLSLLSERLQSVGGSRMKLPVLKSPEEEELAPDLSCLGAKARLALPVEIRIASCYKQKVLSDISLRRTEQQGLNSTWAAKWCRVRKRSLLRVPLPWQADI